MENNEIFKDMPEGMKDALMQIVKETVQKRIKVQVKAKMDVVNKELEEMQNLVDQLQAEAGTQAPKTPNPKGSAGGGMMMNKLKQGITSQMKTPSTSKLSQGSIT